MGGKNRPDQMDEEEEFIESEGVEDVIDVDTQPAVYFFLSGPEFDDKGERISTDSVDNPEELKLFPEEIKGVRPTGVNDHGLVEPKKEPDSRALEPASKALFDKVLTVNAHLTYAKTRLGHLKDWMHFVVVKDLELLLGKLYKAYSSCSDSVRRTGNLDLEALESLNSIEIPSEAEVEKGIQKALDHYASSNAFEDFSPTNVSSPTPEPAPVAPSPAPLTPIKHSLAGTGNHLTGLSVMISAVAATVLAVAAQQMNEYSRSHPEVEPSAEPAPADDSIVVQVPTAPAPVPAPEVASPVFTPVYDSLVAKITEGADQDLRIAVANQWLVERHEDDAHDWTDIRQDHPWKEGPQALKALLGHLEDWGGYKDPLLAYEAAKARGEEPQSISELLNLVVKDPQLAKGTALRIAREIPLIKDERINSDLQLVLDAHQTLNGYVDQTVNSVQSEYVEGRLKRPAPSVYEMDSSLGALQLNVSAETALAELEDLPDVTEYLEPLEDDSTQNAPSEAPSLSSLLADFKADVSASTENLFKKSRGANRDRIRAFNEEFEIAIQAFVEKVPSMTVAEQREGIYELKTKRFKLLESLARVDGKYGKYSNYLREPIAHEMQQLAQMEALLPVEGNIDAMRENIGRSALATLPDIFHQGPRKRNKRA